MKKSIFTVIIILSLISISFAGIGIKFYIPVVSELTFREKSHLSYLGKKNDLFAYCTNDSIKFCLGDGVVRKIAKPKDFKMTELVKYEDAYLKFYETQMMSNHQGSTYWIVTSNDSRRLRAVNSKIFDYLVDLGCSRSDKKGVINWTIMLNDLGPETTAAGIVLKETKEDKIFIEKDEDIASKVIAYLFQ
jgi:hypothetical protein